MKKPYHCQWPGCTNSYARSEHLNRHKLNRARPSTAAKESWLILVDEPLKIFVCDQCPKTFVRSDLLFRHKDRHAKKAVRKSAAVSRSFKSIRPARSESASSREGANSPPSPASSTQFSRSYETASSAESGHGRSQSLTHPRTLLQSPFSRTPGAVSPSHSMFEGSLGRSRSNTLPLPVITTVQDPLAPYRQTHFDFNFHQHQPSVSPVLPPIREALNPRTYTLESILNSPARSPYPLHQGPIGSE